MKKVKLNTEKLQLRKNKIANLAIAEIAQLNGGGAVSTRCPIFIPTRTCASKCFECETDYICCKTY